MTVLTGGKERKQDVDIDAFIAQCRPRGRKRAVGRSRTMIANAGKKKLDRSPVGERPTAAKATPKEPSPIAIAGTA